MKNFKEEIDKMSFEEALAELEKIVAKLEGGKESLENAIHVLSQILSNMNSGTYTKEQAALDAENLMMTDGLDFISCILDYSESEEVAI